VKREGDGIERGRAGGVIGRYMVGKKKREDGGRVRRVRRQPPQAMGQRSTAVFGQWSTKKTR